MKTEADVQVVDAEVVDSPPPSKDSVTGAFLPGHSIGRPKGSKGAISRKVRDEFLEEMERRGPGSNPLICLLDLGTDPTIKPEVRSASLARLCSFILPKPENKFGGDSGARPSVDVRVMAVLNEPHTRRVMERLAIAQAKSTFMRGDSHIIEPARQIEAGAPAAGQEL